MMFSTPASSSRCMRQLQHVQPHKLSRIITLSPISWAKCVRISSRCSPAIGFACYSSLAFESVSRPNLNLSAPKTPQKYGNARTPSRIFHTSSIRAQVDKPPSSDSSKLADPNPPPLPATPLKDRIKAFTPYENIYTVPNVLTFSRLAAAPLIGYLVIHDSHAWALGLFAYAGITDLVDGWIARRWKVQTVVGSVVDPMADKMLMTILTVCLAAKGAMPVWCATLILGRDILLAISAIYYRYISLPPPKTFTRYWDFSLPSAEVHPTTISKINTVLQLMLIGWTVSMPMLTAWGLNSPELASALMAMQYLVGTTTIWSGLSYIYNKDAVKILSPAEQKQRQAETQSKTPTSIRRR